ncbi:MAG: hypothetical protein KC777_22450 [Cyanobacteria bacterium HKST-UBA02]|nr:hypothetical protein [Candidatus Melainabacteria bacterium]MCA9804756.1 hypothetical protein [Cyanobacteria bacterium HKST-UBA02]
MPQQKGVKRARKVLARSRKLKERARQANFKRLEREAEEPQEAAGKEESKD